MATDSCPPKGDACNRISRSQSTDNLRGGVRRQRSIVNELAPVAEWRVGRQLPFDFGRKLGLSRRSGGVVGKAVIGCFPDIRASTTANVSYPCVRLITFDPKATLVIPPQSGQRCTSRHARRPKLTLCVPRFNLVTSYSLPSAGRPGFTEFSYLGI